MNDQGSKDGVTRLRQHLEYERISRRAYELFELRHRSHGHDQEDWFRAEANEVQMRSEGPVPARDYGLGSSYGDRTRKARL
jgi:hypothetical protein